MIWEQEGIKRFMLMVSEPGYEPEGCCFYDGISFVVALATAIDDLTGGEPLLEALREKWPEAVESYMQEAKDLLATLDRS